MATPVEWLAAFQANTGTANSGDNLFDPQIIGLQEGNFLVAWTEAGVGGVGTTGGNDIIGQLFSPEGNPIGTAKRLNTNRNAHDEDDFDIAATNDGGFILVYVDDDTTLTNQESIMWERFDSDANATDSLEVATNNIAADVLSNPTVVVNNSNNESYVTFTDDVGVDLDVRAVKINAIGVITTAEFNAAQNSTDRDADADTAINTNGELVSIYEETDTGTIGIEMRVYDMSGALQHATTVASGPANDPHVATLTNGNIVAVWEEGTTVTYRVYNENLGAIAGPFTVDGSGDNHNEPQIVALPDGGFVIVWDNDTDNTLEARRFNDNGSVNGTDTVFVIEPAAGTEVTPNVGVAGDGRVLFTWEEGNDIDVAIWDTRGGAIDTNDYDGLPINFIESDVATTNVIDTTVTGDSDSETILGQVGNDSITGGTGVDTIEGGGGNDTIEGGFSTDEVSGDGGNDVFVINNGEFSDNIVGGSGSDTLDLSGRNDLALNIDLLAGTYTNHGPGNTISSVETIIGTQLDDTISSTFGVQTLDGQGGNDLFINGDGQFIDDIDGGTGIDTLDLSAVAGASEAVTIDLVAGTWSGLNLGRTIANIEVILGTQENDSILGSTGNDSIVGNAGNDTLSGNTGQDTIEGLGGNDVINMGGGVDVALGGGGNDTINGDAAGDDLQGGAGADVLDGGSGADSIDGGSGGDTIDGGTSNDTIDGGNAADLINGGAGNDLINGEGFTDTINGGDNNDTISGGGSSDILNGDGGADLIFGNNGADTIDGGAGSDSLNGGALNDEINGGTGNDTLNGTTGDDRLTGGTGSDVFFFRANNGTFDRIFDFEDGTDLIQFNIGSVNDISDLTLTDVFSGVDIDYGSGLIRVLGSSASDFSNADFIF